MIPIDLCLRLVKSKARTSLGLPKKKSIYGYMDAHLFQLFVRVKVNSSKNCFKSIQCMYVYIHIFYIYIYMYKYIYI